MFDDPFYATPLGEDNPAGDEILGDDSGDDADFDLGGQVAGNDEYSDDVLEKCVDRASAYWKDFAKSEYFSGLTEPEKENSRSIVESFADKMYSYHLTTMEKWNVQDMEDVCVGIIPRKTTAEDGYFKAIAPVLAAFFTYLGTRGGILPDAANLSNKARTLGPDIVNMARDPENWGFAKSFAMIAHSAGFDLTNENDMGKAIMAYNTKALANHVAGKRPDPVMIGIPTRTNKIGRNERCPCGSGLKYKRCCGKPTGLQRNQGNGNPKSM